MIETIVIAKNLNTFEDKKSHARTIAFPFDFPTGQHGVLMITRLNKFDWQPSVDIEEIVIKFKDHENPST